MVLKKSASKEVFKHIKSTFDIEMDNKFFKQTNVEQVKGNATKLEFANCTKNLNDSTSFIQKSLV